MRVLNGIVPSAMFPKPPLPNALLAAQRMAVSTDVVDFHIALAV